MSVPIGGLGGRDGTGGAPEGILWDIVDEHLDEAEFLLEQWLGATRSLIFSLDLMQRTIEPRLTAHLDALVVGGRVVAQRATWPTLMADGDVGDCRRAAAGLALLSDADNHEAADRLVDLLRETARAEIRGAVCRALQLTARAGVAAPVRRALGMTESPPCRAALLSILAARGADPGRISFGRLRADDEANHELCAALNALAAAAEDRDEHRPLVEAGLSHPHPAVRGAALYTGLVWNLAIARDACIAEARAGAPEAMAYWASLGGAGALPSLIGALESPRRRAAALFALGFTGYADSVEACLPWLEDDDRAIARVAVESIAHITGLALDDDRFARPPADDGATELPPLADDLPADLTLSSTDGMPDPCSDAIRKWWVERASSFEPARRYLRGKPLARASLEATCRLWPLSRLRGVACEIAIRTNGEIPLEGPRLDQPALTLPAETAALLQRPPSWR